MSERHAATIPSVKSFNVIRLLLGARGPFACLAIALGGLGLALALVPAVAGLAPHPLAALGIVGLGVAVLGTRRFGDQARWRFSVLGAIVMICAARLMDGLLAQVAGFAPNTMFGPVGPYAGTFDIQTAIVLGAFAMAALDYPERGRWGGAFLATGAAVVFTALLQISFGVPMFGGHMAGLGFAGLLAANGAMVTLYLDRQYVRVILLAGPLGQQARVMAAAILTIPWLTGAVVWREAEAVAAADVAVLSIVTCSMLLLLLATLTRRESGASTGRRLERRRVITEDLEAVSGTYSHHGMMERVQQAWIDFRRGGAVYGMILIDLDFFRAVDRVHGKDDANGVLTRVEDTLRSQLRGTDAVGRWGNDDILILLRVQDISNVFLVATRLRAAVANRGLPFAAALDGSTKLSNVPVGISELRVEDAAATDAILRADQNLHLSKLEDVSPEPAANRLPSLLFNAPDDTALCFNEAPPTDADSLRDLRATLDTMIAIAEDAEGKASDEGQAA